MPKTPYFSASSLATPHIPEHRISSNMLSSAYSRGWMGKNSHIQDVIKNIVAGFEIDISSVSR